MQVTFSTPGIRRPEKEISDDELLGTLQQIIGQLEGYDVTSGQNVICGLAADQRTELQKELNEAREAVAVHERGRTSTVDSNKKLKDQLNQAVVSAKLPLHH